VGGTREITANVTHTPSILPHKVYWYIGNNQVLKEGSEEPYEGETYNFSPSEANEQGYSIRSEVAIFSPNEAEEWGTREKSNPVIISVLPRPSDVVTSETLQQVVEEPDPNPKKLVAYVGQTDDNDNPISFSYNVKEAPNSKYKWKYTWEFTKQGSEPIKNDGSNVVFDEDGTYHVTLKAQAQNPDTNLGEEENWGNPIPYSLEHEIEIYKAPSLSLKDNHKDNDSNYNISIPEGDEQKYVIYVGESFDVSKLFETDGGYVDKEGSSEFGWIPTLTVDGNEVVGTTFTPSSSSKDGYQLKLVVKNEAPTGTWYNKEGSSLDYVLRVLDKPEYDITNIEELFAKAQGTDLYDTDLHIKSGDNLEFKLNVSGGDENKWNVRYTIDDEEPSIFEKTEDGYKKSFEKSNDGSSEKVYNVTFHISNDIECLTAGSEYAYAEFNKTIHVWKDITAGLNEGSTEIETRQGDGNKTIGITLVGGDPE
jgi:hypothetical protein